MAQLATPLGRTGVALVALLLTGCSDPVVPISSASPLDASSTVDAEPASAPASTETAAPASNQPVPDSTDAGSDAPTPRAEGSGCAPGTPDTLPDGRWFGMLVTESDDALELDLACWFTGDQAILASGYEIVENDYFIRNENPQLRTLPVADTARAIRMINGRTDQVDVVTWSELMADHGSFSNGCPGRDCLAWVTVADGVVVEIEMQFVP